MISDDIPVGEPTRADFDWVARQALYPEGRSTREQRIDAMPVIEDAKGLLS